MEFFIYRDIQSGIRRELYWDIFKYLKMSVRPYIPK